MKKLLAAIIAILLVFGGFLYWSVQKTPAEPAPVLSDAPAPESAPAEEPAAVAGEPADAAGESAEPVEIRRLDFDAIRALYPADEPVLSMEGESVSWGEYSDILCATGMDIQNYFEQMAAYYGMAADWNGSVGDDTGRSFAEYAVDDTRRYLESCLAVRGFAAEQGVTLSEEELQSLEPEALAKEILGEEATAEELFATLQSEGNMSYETYRSMRETGMLYDKTVDLLYGHDGEKVSEEEAVAWLEEQGFLAAGHILLMTMDPNTGEALDEEAARAKETRAGEIAAELQGIKDREKLLKRFAELKEAECEDTGKTVYPDGYTFEPGTMVTEFEEAVRGLKDYAVSDPVQTAYGYHVIMRLPLQGDASLITLTGDGSSARQALAQTGISSALEAFQAEHPAQLAAGLDTLDLTAFLK